MPSRRVRFEHLNKLEKIAPRPVGYPGSKESRFMEDERERISFILKQLLPLMIQEVPNLTQKRISKNAMQSENLRVQANKIFAKKPHSSHEHMQIWKLYSKSIALAPPFSKELSSALYNRSSLSIHLDKQIECNQDLMYAEKCECSEILKMKIIYQKAATSTTTRSSSVDEIVKSAISDIESLSLDEAIKSGTVAKLKQMHVHQKTSKKLDKKDDISGDFKIDFQDEIPYGRNRGFSEDGVFRSESCESYLSLITNADKKPVVMLEDVSKKVARIAVFLATFTDIFGKRYTADNLLEISKNEDVLFIGSLMSRLFHSGWHNEFTLGEQIDITPRRAWSNQMDNKEVPHDQENIGTAIVPFCSFINHACLLNVATLMTEDGRLVIFAVLPIEKGSQIFKRYMNRIACDECPKKMRRELMQALYHISDCKCLACIKDFPTAQEAPPIFNITNDRPVLDLMTRKCINRIAA
ncbi:hypothetical protein QAD02_008711 [Eretmocerus hayati]|uniref:Uncharacterized protein n=1 Tax=Eretmocerus hayati TaxID=131215 RepID=A0ACC2N7L4_9HYME|nr:hypothetical protein QAD02_008711 [Eretmocerus hayati]